MKNLLEVLLIDDHPLAKKGIASWLEETGKFSVCGQAASLAEARQLIESAGTCAPNGALPDLIILDIMLGEENGLDFLPFLKQFCNEKGGSMPPVLVCSVIEEPFRIRSALSAGASGYIAKTASKAELLTAIDTMMRGEVFVSNEHDCMLTAKSDIYSKFTAREKEVLNLIKKNETNKSIAEKLGLSVRTIENHISNIYFKTGAKTRQELLKL